MARRHAHFHKAVDEEHETFPLHTVTAILVGGRWLPVSKGSLRRYLEDDSPPVVAYEYVEDEGEEETDSPVVVVSAEAVAGFRW